MITQLDFWNLLHLLGAAQGLFLAVLFLFHRRGNRAANRFLGVLLLIFSLRLLEIVAYWTRYVLVVPDFFLTTYPLAYLFGVMLFLYVERLIAGDRVQQKRIWPHFIPFFVCLLYMAPYYALSREIKLAVVQNALDGVSGNNGISPLRFLIYALQFPHVLIYLVISVKRLRIHRATIKDPDRDPVKARLLWLRRLMTGFGLFFTAWFVYGLAVGFGLPYQRPIDYAVTILMTLFIYTTGYFAFRVPEVFSLGDTPGNGPKYEKSVLTEERANRYLNELQRIMEKEKPYQKNDLKLPDLASRLGISTNLLSQIINEYLNRNFFDYINQLRVDEAKRRMLEPEYQHHTLLSIAFDVGFNNKTSFNSSFKKLTGMTPSEFKRKANHISS